MSVLQPVQEWDLESITPEALAGATDSQLKAIAAQLLPRLQEDRRECQLYHYVPASEDAMQIHRSDARTVLASGGNGSAKSTTILVELSICCTGVVPKSLQDVGIDWKKKLRGPIKTRFICQSITNTMHSVILPMLRWNQWYGIDAPGGDKGHWGWIPKDCLIDGSWEKSWSEKYRTLTVLYRNPDNYDEIQGESTIHFMSYEHSGQDIASADLHLVVLDEPPPLAIFREAQARTMRVKGRILMAMTWPDDPTIPVDWLFDEVYERGLPGPNKDPLVDYFELRTTENRNLDQSSVADQIRQWDERQVQVRIQGKPIRFSNRVHELFTDVDSIFCFACGRNVWVTDDDLCDRCGGSDIVEYNHVGDFEHLPSWPCVWALDPHPRKPHMSGYFLCLPDDQIWQVAELECKGDPVEMKLACDDMEAELGLTVRQRLIDPRMGASPSGAKRDRTWIDEFASAGLYCDPADPSDVGRDIVDQMLKPDPMLRSPRARIHVRCPGAIKQMKRFMWDDWKLGVDKDMKQTAKSKYDDYPALWRYVCNSRASFANLLNGYRSHRAVRMSRPVRRPVGHHHRRNFRR